DALRQALRREAAKYHRVRGADPRTGLQRHDDLDRHRHVDEDAIALLDAASFQRVGELADLLVQLLVADLRDASVVGFEDDRGLVRLRLEVTVQAVVRSIELAVVEPAEKW